MGLNFYIVVFYYWYVFFLDLSVMDLCRVNCDICVKFVYYVEYVMYLCVICIIKVLKVLLDGGVVWKWYIICNNEWCMIIIFVENCG